MKDLDRREFTRLSLLAMFSGVTITVAACGGGGGSPAGPSNPQPSGGDERGEITGNHGHTVTLTAAQMTAGGDVTLSLTTSTTPEHTHTVSLSASEVVSVRNGGRVSKQSTTAELHQHTVLFN